MEFQLHDREDMLLIHSLKRDAADAFQIRINETWYQQSLILTPHAVEMWDVKKVSALTPEHFNQLAAHARNIAAEVVLLGTGKTITFPPPNITQAIHHAQVGMEVMDTAAACRTYNVLAGDGRRVVAALFV